MKFLLHQLLVFAVLIPGLSMVAQVATGRPPLGSFSGGPDVINLGNFNAHFEVPIIHKPGRGLPFDFILSLDSSVWIPTSVSGTLSWQPASNWGWRTLTEASVGYISFLQGKTTCDNPDNPRRLISTIIRFNYQYHDQFGVVHNFTNVTGGCPGDLDPSDTISTDASGFTLDTSSGQGTIIAPDGTKINPPRGSPTGGGNRIDRNGNQITTTGTAFTDTLGMTVLSVSGGVPNPVILTYTTASGTPATATINYSSYTVQTNFGCPGVSEYTSATSLVSSIVLPDSSHYTFTYEPTPGFPGNVTGRVQSITLRTGGTITYIYTGGNNGIICADGSTAGLTRTLSHSGITDGITTYARAGFGATWTTTITDNATPVANQSIINFQTTQTTRVPALFFETRRTIYQGNVSSNTLLVQTDTCYNAATPDCSNTAVALPISQIDRYVTLNNNQQSLTTALLGIFGLPTEVDEYDYGTATHGSLLRKTLMNYTALGNGIVGLPASIVVQDGSGNQKSSILYNYDETAPQATSGVPQHVAITGSRGNLTSMTRWLDLPAVKNVTSTFINDDTGNMLTSTDPGGHMTAFSYADNFNDGINRNSLAYLTQVIMPDTHSPNLAHHVTYTQYEPNTGLAVKTIDQNSQQATATYDALGRPLQANMPDGGQTTISYPSTTQTIVQSKIDTQPRFTYSTTLLDSFGRVSRTARANGETVQYDLQDSCYDANGNLRFQTYPYQSTSLTGAQVCSGLGDSFLHDGAGRLVTVTHSDGSIMAKSFLGRAVQTTDEGNGSFNVSRIQQSDALGRLTAVCELSNSQLFGNGGAPIFSCGLDLPAGGFVTSYTHDTSGHLTAISQGGLAPRTFSYDSLGRLLSESHPEWTSATASQAATASYSYNDDDLLTQRSRPKATQPSSSVTATTTYTYDELHRPRGLTYSDGTQSATYNYDEASPFSLTATNTMGRLSSEIAGTGSTAESAFSYDAMGRVVSNWQCTPQFCPVPTFKQLSYQYDLAGDLLSASNGVGVTLSYSYNSAPRLTGMTSTLVGATWPATLLSNVHYGVYGPLNDTLGNGLNETFAYNPYGAVKSYTSTPYSFSLTFASNWSITAANDSVNGNWTYAYDEFNRLASSNKNAGAQTFTYKYDRYGNRWQQNANQGPAPQYIFDTNNHISGSGVTYDSLGNVTNDGLGNAYTYDAENRLTQVVNSSGTFTYTYDAEGRRVRNTSGTEVLYDLAGRPITLFNLVGGWSYGEIYAGGRHMATYSGATTNFLHTDWLGSKRVMTGPAGANSETCTSVPFGDAFTCTGTDWNFSHFTDDVHDSESNLEHTWFRQYSSTQGRFTTTDPYGGSMDLDNPQSLNRYTYVSNDPVNLTDPTGLLGADDGCTLLSGMPGDVFECAWWIGSDGQSGFGGGGGGGFSFGVFGGGFGGLPIPGCILPGACPISSPWPSLADLLPSFPTPCSTGPVIVENCNGQGTGNSLFATGIGSLTAGMDPISGLVATCTCKSNNADPRRPPNAGPNAGFCDYTCDCFAAKKQTFSMTAIRRNTSDNRCQITNKCPTTLYTGIYLIDSGIYKKVFSCGSAPPPPPSPEKPK